MLAFADCDILVQHAAQKPIPRVLHPCFEQPPVGFTVCICQALHQHPPPSPNQRKTGAPGESKILQPCSTFLESTFNYQNHDCCRLPIISIQGFIIRTYKKCGFGCQGYSVCLLDPGSLSPRIPNLPTSTSSQRWL